MFGEYAADLVVGNATRHAYCFIEFEDAKDNSIFSKAGKYSRDWSSRFEHGYSQPSDWIQKLTECSGTHLFTDRLGPDPITFDMALIIGRDTRIETVPERRRLVWCRNNVVTCQKQII